MSGSPKKEGDERLKIDYDLVREILLFVEDKSDGVHSFRSNKYVDNIGGNKETSIKVAYHVKFLIDVGYIEGDRTPFYNPLILDITPSGREFLSATREQSVWVKTKEKLGTALADRTAGEVMNVAFKLTSKLFDL